MHGTGEDLTNTQYELQLWTSFSECFEGRGLGDCPMEGIFVEMGGVGVGSNTW